VKNKKDQTDSFIFPGFVGSVSQKSKWHYTGNRNGHFGSSVNCMKITFSPVTSTTLPKTEAERGIHADAKKIKLNAYFAFKLTLCTRLFTFNNNYPCGG
jgi:hypothetical protein